MTLSPLAVCPLNAALPATPGFRCSESCRGVGHYLACAAQFHVATEPRYSPRDGNTYCNVYAWDVTCAMGCEVPHWVDGAGNPCAPGYGHELTINAAIDWLRSDAGLERGWREVNAAEAELRAGAGHPTLATYSAPHGHGHVAVVLPSTLGPRIAQAGARNFFDRPMAEGFGSLPLAFFSHP